MQSTVGNLRDGFPHSSHGLLYALSRSTALCRWPTDPAVVLQNQSPGWHCHVLPLRRFFFGQMTKCDSDARQGCTCKMLTFSKGWFCFKLSPQLELDLHSTALQFKKCVPYLSCFLPCPLRFFFIGEGPYLWSAGFPISSFSLALPLINKALVQITSSWHLYLGGSGQTQMAWTCAGGCLGRKGKYANPALWVWSVCNGCQERCGEIF